jgi:hypothetical protein
VHDHFKTFRAQAASLLDKESLPRFVEHAFRTFLQFVAPRGTPPKTRRLTRRRCES